MFDLGFGPMPFSTTAKVNRKRAKAIKLIKINLILQNLRLSTWMLINLIRLSRLISTFLILSGFVSDKYIYIITILI